MIVMFHHVHDDTYELSRIGHLPAANFYRQLQALRDETVIADSLRFYEVSSEGASLLTFDDGLRSHFEFVRPTLNSLGVKGTFYVPALPYLKNKICSVHLLHFLLAYLPLSSWWKVIDGENFKSVSASASYRNQSTSELIKRIKTLFNYDLEAVDARNRLIYLLEKVLGLREKHILRQLYMSEQEIAILKADGHQVHSHFNSHCLLGKLEMCDLRFEFETSQEFAVDVLRSDFDEVCVPYGCDGSWTEDCHSLAGSFDVKRVVMVDEISCLSQMTESCVEYIFRTDCSQLQYAAYEGGLSE